MVRECKKYVDLVVVVDDGSSDATAEIAGLSVAKNVASC